ncbi:hypothetical protein GCM10010909_07990 [Acidocella aquatica]|uniref:DUF4105 domain-containing protein n=2 Tax=Acidocella aquatica TaxID=1922313 RepID=A0ABQ6A5H4_9PROT|nr:hypothetical protein GCM10010909_07990 [Acidocella aquatica]
MKGTGGAAYEQFYPYYAELCALSELRKKPGFGIPLRSGMGGHSLLYLNGVRLDRTQGYPVLELCAPDASPGSQGVGISVNSHYKNANWVAAEGRDFLWRGALKPGEPLTREAYERTQHHAKAMGVLDGVQFHDHLFRDKPSGMTERDYMYEISVATDYAAQFGRDTFRTRIPLDHARMSAIVDFLNGINAPYRDGTRVYNWRLFNDNCGHVAHNALAAAGVWAPWPTGQFFALAAFNFPVPKNELVDLALRTNDLPIQNPKAIYKDRQARQAFLTTGFLPTAPGALAAAAPAVADNEVYDINRLRLIFYDNPFWGPYRHRFARIFTEPRYLDLRANLRHFEKLYATALKSRGATGQGAGFQMRYNEYAAREAAKVRGQLACLEQSGALPVEVLP